MNFREIIDRARSRCRESLIASYQQRRECGEEIITEPAPRNQAGAILSAPDGLMLPLRYDYVARKPGSDYQSHQADTVTIRFSEPVFATWEGTLRIEVRSIAWDYLRIECFDGAFTDFEPLRSWFLKWVDFADEVSPDKDDLHGVVHFISDPVYAERSVSFFVDLGSSRSESLAELFDVLVAAGVTHCILGDTEVAS